MDLTCRLYIHGAENLDDLATLILAHCVGARTGRTISTPVFEIDLELSDDTDPAQFDTRDGFLYWPFGAFIEPSSTEVMQQDYIEAVSSLITHLRGSGLKTVASCDFEDNIADITGWNWSEASPKHP